MLSTRYQKYSGKHCFYYRLTKPFKMSFAQVIHQQQQSFRPSPGLNDFSRSSTFFFLFSLNLTCSRWTSSLPPWLSSIRIFLSRPGSRLTIFVRDASLALLQLVNQWLNFTYSRSHAFRYERKNTNPTLVRIKLRTSALAGVQVIY